MSGMPWLKHSSEKRTDPRVQVLTLPTKAIYYMLTEVAAQCDADGSFTFNSIELNDDQLAKLIDVELADFKRAKKEMFKSGILSANGHGPFLTDFAEDQIAQEARREKWRRWQRDHRHDVNPDNSADVMPDTNPDVNTPRVRIQSQNQNQIKNQSQSKNQNQPTTPTPPSNDRRSGRVAGADSKSDSSSTNSNGEKKLTRKQLAVIAHIKPILQQSGLRNPLLDRTLNAIVTIRNFKSKEKALSYVLGALASTYAEDGIHNKNAVAAHRIENNNVPAEYVEKPELWKSLPGEVLNAAGIDDLDHYIRRSKYASGLDQKIQSLRDRSDDDQ